jgi:hypothetical protein
MKTNLKSLPLAALLFGVITTAATAEERGYSATQCTTNGSNIFYTFRGAEVSGLSTGTLFCGAAPVVGANVDRIQATVHDRNPDSNACCTMMVLNSEGMAVASASRCSTGNSNAAQLLSADFPANVANSAELQCTIPGAAPTGVSRLLTYRVRTTP